MSGTESIASRTNCEPMIKLSPTTFFLWVIQLSSICGESPITHSSQGVAETMRVLLLDKSISYQRMLRDASHLVRTNYAGKLWTEVEKTLHQDGLRQILAKDEQHTTRYEYLVADDVHVDPSHLAHQLYFSLLVDRRATNLFTEAKTGSVMEAAAGLCVSPNLGYKEVLAGEWYPKNSVLFDALRLPSVLSVANEHPVLKKLKIVYDYIEDRHASSVQQGFHVQLLFGDSVQNNREGKQLFLTVGSGLDAPEGPAGQPVQKYFVERDTYGKFRSWGSTEWK